MISWKELKFVIGVAILASYMLCILFTWMRSDLIWDQTMFTAGEPRPLIKYTEWILGFYGLWFLWNLVQNYNPDQNKE